MLKYSILEFSLLLQVFGPQLELALNKTLVRMQNHLTQLIIIFQETISSSSVVATNYKMTALSIRYTAIQTPKHVRQFIAQQFNIFLVIKHVIMEDAIMLTCLVQESFHLLTHLIGHCFLMYVCHLKIAIMHKFGIQLILILLIHMSFSMDVAIETLMLPLTTASHQFLLTYG